MIECIDPGCIGCPRCASPRVRLLDPPEILSSVLSDICDEWEIEVERVPDIVHPHPETNNGRTVVGIALGNRILLRKDLGIFSPEHLSTWVHELAHEFLHYQKDGKPAPKDEPRRRNNRIGYPVSPYDLWECEAESVTLHFFNEMKLPWAKLALHYDTVERRFLTDAQRALLRLLLKRFQRASAELPVAPEYLWNTIPADPRYEGVGKMVTF
jgi:hypothetical protein